MIRTEQENGLLRNTFISQWGRHFTNAGIDLFHHVTINPKARSTFPVRVRLHWKMWRGVREIQKELSTMILLDEIHCLIGKLLSQMAIDKFLLNN